MEENVIIILLSGVISACVSALFVLATRPKEMEPVDCFADKKKCETCKGWFDKGDMQEVMTNGNFSQFATLYCQIHKKPYDFVIPSWHTVDKETQYFSSASRRVDEKGKEIK